RAPDDLVEDGKREEEQSPAQRQLAPALLGEFEDRIENHAEQRLAEGEAAQEHGAEQYINDRRLELDEFLVLQNERRAAEHHHHYGGDHRHCRQVAGLRIADRERDQYCRDEYRGRREDPGMRTIEQVRRQERRQ